MGARGGRKRVRWGCESRLGKTEVRCGPRGGEEGGKVGM